MSEIVNRLAAKHGRTYKELPAVHQEFASRRYPPSFLNALLHLNVSLAPLSMWCESLGRPRPNAMTYEQRKGLIQYLRTDQGMERFRTFE